MNAERIREDFPTNVGKESNTETITVSYKKVEGGEMANREACEVYIEQEIREGLQQGKKPYSIGKELSAWVEKLFEVNIKPVTIEKRQVVEKRCGVIFF